MNVLYILPKNLLSRWVGGLLQIEFGGKISQWLVCRFASVYNINVAEAELPIEQYPSIGKFFIRKLKPGARLLAPHLLVHPADSRISQIGFLAQGDLIQAKGKTYSVESFLQDTKAGGTYQGGFFATYYLCPTDYHRVHSPVSGRILSVTHIPGTLWPVNEWSVERIDQLFCVNERVVIEIETDLAGGKIAVVFVGATNVGKISLSFEPQIISNQSGSRKPRKILYNPHRTVKKGDELGMFHMGSTVVVVASKALVDQLDRAKCQVTCDELRGHAVKMGGGLF